MSLKYTPVTQSILCLSFLMYIRTTQHFVYSGEESKRQFAVYDADTPVTLKQGQDHQIWYKLEDPKQGYNNAKFKKNSLEQCP